MGQVGISTAEGRDRSRTLGGRSRNITRRMEAAPARAGGGPEKKVAGVRVGKREFG